ncbi:MAG: hypothetical protein MJ252_18175 [archaeon]|nr:hypothetical protein [archaeon]
MDPKPLAERHLGEFFGEFKNRITQIQPYMGMPGSQGYSMKINRLDINSSLEIYLTQNFPYERPICQVKPPFQNEIVDSTGRINDPLLFNWNFNTSNLKNTIKEILNKLELRGNKSYGVPSPAQLGSGYSNSNDDQLLTRDLSTELNKKSIEELIYINFNPEHFIYEFTEPMRKANEKLLDEVKELNNQFEMKKNQYEMIKGNVENCRRSYEEKERMLRDIYAQKTQMDNSMTVDKLIEEINKYINENFQKPRQKLLNDFMSKKIENFDEFKEKYKELSMKFHYYSIIRDKLNLCK